MPYQGQYQYPRRYGGRQYGDLPYRLNLKTIHRAWQERGTSIYYLLATLPLFLTFDILT